MTETHDVVIVGAGVVGLFAARELLRRDLSVLIVDKEEDVGRGASGRNSGVIHSGFAVTPGSLKARLNLQGARLMRTVCEELDVPLAEVGTLVVASDESQLPELQGMLDAGRRNGLEHLRIIDGRELSELEPSVAGHAALFSPEGAIINPFTLLFGLTDCCLANGCEIMLGTEVAGLARNADGWTVSTSGGTVRSRVVVNAAGVGAPAVSRMAGAEEYPLYPCRGEYLVLDRQASGVPDRMVYPVPPTSGGLGVHFTPTTSGNTLVGPSAEHVDDGEDYATSRAVLPRLFEEAKSLCPGFNPSDVITSFAGVRAKIAEGAYGTADFVVEDSRRAPGLINAIGIESPGLTASPAIGELVAELALSHLPKRSMRAGYKATASTRLRFGTASSDERRLRAESDIDDRTIVCRCEQVTRREVLDALNNPLGVRSLAGVRLRCRAGAGRCQGSFCGPRIVDILREDLGVSVSEMSLRGPGSELFAGEAKELLT